LTLAGADTFCLCFQHRFDINRKIISEKQFRPRASRSLTYFQATLHRRRQGARRRPCRIAGASPPAAGAKNRRLRIEGVA
jgi:hypothetical protein